ncbi:MAG: GntR family transcriptional regulator, partial [Rhizobacter sp.]|nr:GntR family transcriptional regulator [Rhizobacter sp.]
MPIQNVSTQRLYSQIADQLGDLIRSGEFKPGDRLPSERDLSQQLNVSRASVREALIALEIYGLIVVRVGLGIFVNAAPVLNTPLTVLAEPGPFEVLAARCLVEGETAALAALNADAQDHARIRETLTMMADEVQGAGTGLSADALFHVRIAEASKNGALVHLVNQLWNFRHSEMFRKLDEHFDSPARHADAIMEHRQLAEAIERRDAPAARAAMEAHLGRVRDALERGWELANVAPTVPHL